MSDDRGTGISNRIITLDVDTWMGAGQARTKKLKQFQERPLDNFDFVVFFIDGKSFADEQIVIALGVTMDGQKIPLGFVESATENERVCRQVDPGSDQWAPVLRPRPPCRSERFKGPLQRCHKSAERACPSPPLPVAQAGECSQLST